MAANASKKEAPTEHDSGIARVRERTIILGDTLITIDNIGSIQILDVTRNWALARWGAVAAIIGVGAFLMPSNPYSSSGSPGPVFGMIFMALGVVMIVGNWLQPLRKGLAIGTSDGRLSYIVSENHAFLHRLLEVLTQKINTRNEGLTAVVDITNTTVNINGGAVAIGDNATVTGVDNSVTTTDNSINSGGGGLVIGANGVASGTGAQAAGHGATITNSTLAAPAATPPPAPAPPPPAPPPPAAAAPLDPDEALFADDPPAATPPPPPPQPRADAPAPPRVVAAERTRPRDPLLDGPGTAPKDDDWLSAPGRVGYRAEKEGGARWLLPLVLLLLVGGGGFAGWYFYTQSQGATSISLMAPTTETPPVISAAAPATTVPELPAAPTPDTTVAPVETPAPAPEAPAAEPAPITPDVVAPTSAAGEISSFSPPETIVARASGLRYRASPSAAENVQIIAETRAGGEALLVNGRVTQPDGDWYRVAMPDGRAAWFKASLTVPRSRFAETFAIGPAQAASFAAAAPRILEPAEGVQLAGGPQPVRLAWQGPDNASIYIVEIETYDNVTKRWIEDPPHKRVTVERMDELAESIPRTGAWRWRVRGVSPAGEQSQFSRWSAFGIRD